jgi:hypothetical protein
LYCWLVTSSSGKELALVRSHHARTESVFACERWSVFSDKAVGISMSPTGPVAQAIGSISSKRAPWGSWLNTPTFRKAWDAVIRADLYREAAWTVKVDPDTLFCPDRLRRHLGVIDRREAPAVFLRNYDAEHLPGSSDFVGALEVFSKEAVAAYAAKGHTVCAGASGIDTLEEANFMNYCMSNLGVHSVRDYTLVKHACAWCPPLDLDVCSGCKYVAFHPLDSQERYQNCSSLCASVKHALEV